MNCAATQDTNLLIGQTQPSLPNLRTCPAPAVDQSVLPRALHVRRLIAPVYALVDIVIDLRLEYKLAWQAAGAAGQVRLPHLVIGVYTLAVLYIALVRAQWRVQTELLLGDAAVGGGAVEIILKAAAVAGSGDWGTEADLAVTRDSLVIPAV